MSENPKLISREEFEKVIVKKAREDEDFKRALLEKPHEAIAQFGVQIPEEVEIMVLLLIVNKIDPLYANKIDPLGNKIIS